MGRLAKYLLLLLLTALIIVAGFYFGHQLGTSEPNDSSVEETTDQASLSPAELQQQQIDAAKHADYMAGPPHFGPLIQTQEVTVTFDGDVASGPVPVEATEKIAAGQKVILYDKEGYTLPLGGKVSGAALTEDQTSAIISIALPEGTTTDLLLPQMDIITLETTASKRLPLSALRKDENGSPYVWKALQTDFGSKDYNLSRQYIQVGTTDLSFFEEDGHKIDSNDVIVFDPDDKIRSDRPYELYVTTLNAPLHNPIKQAWIDYELHYLDTQQQEMTQIAEDCHNGKKQQPPATSGAASLPDGSYDGAENSCGGATGGQTDPLQVFRNLTRTSGSNDSCGGASAACGQ